MAPTRVGKARSSKQERYNAERESHYSGSNTSEENDTAKLAEEMRKKAKKRREQRRALIDSQHLQKMTVTEGMMKARLNEISKTMIETRMDRLQRIKNLIKRKAALEANVLASSDRVELAYILVHHAFQYALQSQFQHLGIDERHYTSH